MGQGGKTSAALDAPYVIVSEFFVKSGRTSEFETRYGPRGDWARF